MSVTRYIPPDFPDLVGGIDDVEEDYTHNNLKRRKQIEITRTILDFAYKATSTTPATDTSKHYLAVAAYECIREQIHLKEYHGKDATFVPGTLYNTGSLLYTLYTQQLDINAGNPMDEHRSLIYLINMLVNLDDQDQLAEENALEERASGEHTLEESAAGALTESASDVRTLEESTSQETINEYANRTSILLDENDKSLSDYLDENHINCHEVKNHLLNLIKLKLKYTDKDLAKYINLLSSEKAIRHRLRRFTPNRPETQRESNLFKDYVSAKQKAGLERKTHTFLYRLFEPYATVNEERMFFAQLAVALAHILKQDKPNLDSSYTRSHMILIGMILFFMRSINSTSSELYKLCGVILNINQPDDLTQQMQLDCISAFKSYIGDNKTKKKLEKAGAEIFKHENMLHPIDYKLNKLVEEKIPGVILNLEYSGPITWPVTATAGMLLGFLCAPVGYGAGSFLGYMASKSVTAAQPTINLANFVNYVGTAVLGPPGGIIGGFCATSVMEFTLIRLLAKVLEPMSKMVGLVAGTVIAVPIDLTYFGFRQVVACCLKMYEKLDPADRQNIDIDIEYLESLLKLPPEIFPDHCKARIENTLIQDNIPDETGSEAESGLSEDDFIDLDGVADTESFDDDSAGYRTEEDDEEADVEADANEDYRRLYRSY